MKTLISIIMLTIFLFLSVSPVYAETPYQKQQKEELYEKLYRRVNREKQIEYYRGMYDFCIFTFYLAEKPAKDAIVTCHLAIKKAKEIKMYKKNSPSFNWSFIADLTNALNTQQSVLDYQAGA